MSAPVAPPPIGTLWTSIDPTAWAAALDRYWGFVLPRNLALERSLAALDLGRLRRMTAVQWHEFLRDEYFRWKYTQPNRYASTTRLLAQAVARDGLEGLDAIRQALLNLDRTDIRGALETACRIRGLGPPGGSGLLALMYPGDFGTVDQFVVKALRGVPGLPEAAALHRMKPEGISLAQGVTLMNILRRKAAENNRALGANEWTPRKIDMVLWTYGRGPDCR